MSVSSKRIGSIDQIRSHSTSIDSSAANRSLAAFASASIAARRSRVEMALIEELLGRLHDGCHDSRLADDAAGRADGAAARSARDVADLERELRCARERVAALVHRSRSGMCRLAVPGDSVTLDAECAEDDAEGKLERLEDGTLLDVELEIGGCGVELGPSVER